MFHELAREFFRCHTSTSGCIILRQTRSTLYCIPSYLLLNHFLLCVCTFSIKFRVHSVEMPGCSIRGGGPSPGRHQALGNQYLPEPVQLPCCGFGWLRSSLDALHSTKGPRWGQQYAFPKMSQLLPTSVPAPPC